MTRADARKASFYAGTGETGRMIVADVMTPRSEVVTVELPGTRDDALEYFQDQEFSSVPVVKPTGDGEQYRGILTRDSLIENPDEDQLAILMEEVPTVESDNSVEELCRLMVGKNARRVPVVDGTFEGIVTVTDVIKAVADGDISGDVPVESCASRDLNTCYAGTPLPVVERGLYYANLPYAVVLGDEGDMTGMVTEVDIIAVAEVVEGEENTGDSFADQDDEWMWEGIKGTGSRYLPTRNVEFPEGPVSEFMTEDVVTIGKRKTVQKAAQLMIQHDIEQVPMVSAEELTGIVRDLDVLEALYE
jgi:CBS domain-containing protein